MKIVVVAFLGASLVPALASAQASPWQQVPDGAAKPGVVTLDNSLAVFVGQKQMDSSDWKPVENQLEIGVQGTWRQKGWPVGIATDLFYSTASKSETGTDQFGNPVSVTVDGNTVEAMVGPRFVADVQQFHPYLGAGIGLVRAQVKLSGALTGSDDDTALGFWAGAGAFVRLAEKIDLGIGVRWSKADVTLGNTDGDAGGLHLGATVGVGF